MRTHANFRQYLQEELQRRISGNSSYSARSFARFLGVDSAYLSKILRGERTASESLIRSFSRRLEIREDALERFLEFNAMERGLKSKRILVDIPGGRAYRLLGLAPEAEANLYLRARGFEAVPTEAGAVAVLGIQQCEGTTIGDYLEFYVGFFVTHLGTGTVGYTFASTLVTTEAAGRMYVEKLGVPQLRGAIKVGILGSESAPEGLDIEVSEAGHDGEAGTLYWKASMRARPAEYVPSIEEGSVVAFSMGGEEATAYRIDVSSIQKKKVFRSEEDGSFVNESSRLGQTLAALGSFRPLEWKYIDGFRAAIHEPFRFAGRKKAEG